MERYLGRQAMRRRLRPVFIAVSLAGFLNTTANAQKTLTWDEAKRALEASNPTLRAGQIGIQQSRADEITAFLRPNPDVTILGDQFNPAFENTVRPLSDSVTVLSATYLIERRGKRALRRESAQKATAIAVSEQEDLKRNLFFDLRNAFVQVLQQKAVVAVTHESLDYYDRLLGVSRDRFKAGDISQVDLDRLELQRVQFETDVQTALVNLRTAKIQLEMLLNDRTPVERLDVTGKFDYSEILTPIEEFRQNALDSRADLRAALQAVDKARTDYRLAVANGSTDPTFGADVGRQTPVTAYVGASVSFPLRIFDRNQGEKARTQLDIQRNQRLVDASRAQVFSDVDSAYATLQSNLILLRPYKTHHLPLAVRVRETISFSYQHGGASLLDFLQAQQDYRGIQLSYLNLVGSFLTAANQMNFAVGREVIP
jgi:cobalt-zinc-cadmium efflux system outer membrane protein